MAHMEKGAVIAAVKDDCFASAIASEAEWIFDLSPDIHSMAEKIRLAHANGKKLLIHFDLATGIGKDKSGLQFAKQVGADGILSTRVNMIKAARQLDIFTVQRFFIVDSHSIETTIEALHAAKPDMIEVMPGVVPKVIRNLATRTALPVIAGGLLETEAEIHAVINAGATAVSTGNCALWKKKGEQ